MEDHGKYRRDRSVCNTQNCPPVSFILWYDNDQNEVQFGMQKATNQTTKIVQMYFEQNNCFYFIKSLAVHLGSKNQ